MKLKTGVLFVLTLFLYSNILTAQNIGIGTSSPHASAVLHLNSSNKGLLIPQVTLDSLKDVTSIPSPADGLIVFNTTASNQIGDIARGYYYYSSAALSWVRLADNLNDNAWQNGGTLGIQLRDKTDGVEIMDSYTGSQINLSPKVKILKMLDSTLLNAKNNITALVLSGVNRKTTAGWENRQKTSIIFENTYLATNTGLGATNSTAISSYTESTGTTAGNLTNGLAFYSFAPPQNNALADTPSLSMFRHNVGIGAYVSDINNVTEGRLQITGFSNGDQLSLRHPSSINLKWGLYVSSIDSSLNLYSNGSLRANIDRVTGVYTALSDRRLKKDIVPFLPVLDKIKKLPAYFYRYLDTEPNGRRTLGFMAQDVLPYFPELVYERHDRETGQPFYMLNYDGFGVIAIKAIQEQQNIIEALQTQASTKQVELLSLIEKQQLMIDELVKRLDKIEKK
jgi:Chaperone of endosialidase